MTDLILTEKFSVAADFAKALGVKKKGEGCFEGDDHVITWAVGHLVTLYEPDDYDKKLKKWKIETLPIIPGRFKYKPIRKTVRQFKNIKKLLGKNRFTRIIIATDAGREGEVIARTILFEAGFLDKSRMFRFWTSQALVPEVVRSTMEKLKPITDYDRLWRAGYYRQVSDWMIGMNCTRVLTIRLKDLFSVGRVQTAVLALLTDRKNERDTFVPTLYWTITVVFAGERGKWNGHWFKKKETQLTNKKAAAELYTQLTHETLPGVVQSLKTEKKREQPPYLFSLTDLQQAANIKFGFPAKKTLDIAQRLYQDKKCLSYPRTDSRVLGTQSIDMAKQIIKKLTVAYPEIFKDIDGQKVSLSNKRVFNDAKLTDHHALIPFKPLSAMATGDEKKVFDLVMRRFSAAFHPDCQFENTRIITLFSNETFQTRGKIVHVQGWRQIYMEKTKDKKRIDHIPPLVQGDTGIAETVTSDEKQTQPPPEYSDSLLLKDMTNPGRFVAKEAIKKFYRGDIGIGTQSTRAQIIETLINRKYVHRSGKKLLATDKGVFLVGFLRKCPVSSVLTSPEETARWEMTLNTIALGEGSDTHFLVNIKHFVTEAVSELKQAALASNRVKPDIQSLPLINNGPVCPVCGGKIIEGKKGYGCANWRVDDGNCRFVIWKDISGKTLTAKNIETLLTGKTTRPYVLKDTAGEKFKARMRLIQNTQTLFALEIVPENESPATPGFQVSCSR
ncbi:DNA topoisomerase III [Desulfobacula sp.]|uniref:type IA DNA topoisomerase n=1 Tax=Desulfobacula sp. TaxID=2593537 RepID=UPI002618CA4D|nr:DNA topoisomerase III [Desulfobacula sp.]